MSVALLLTVGWLTASVPLGTASAGQGPVAVQSSAAARRTGEAADVQSASSPAGSGSEEPGAATSGARAIDLDATGLSLERIQKAVTRPQAIKLTESRKVFRVEVFGDKVRIEDILGPDYLKGPVPYSPMTHQEFLNMVTPKAVQGYAAFSNKQGMVVAATSIALQWALQKAIDKLKDAREEHAREAARQEVQQALAALRKARHEAGLPDK